MQCAAVFIQSPLVITLHQLLPHLMLCHTLTLFCHSLPICPGYVFCLFSVSSVSFACFFRFCLNFSCSVLISLPLVLYFSSPCSLFTVWFLFPPCYLFSFLLYSMSRSPPSSVCSSMLLYSAPSVSHSPLLLPCSPLFNLLLLLQGRRRYQEDRCVVADVTPDILLAAIFDGHGGDACSQFCSQHLVSVVAVSW